MIIDTHIHTFPDKLATKAIPILAKNSAPMVTEQLRMPKKLKEWGIDKALVLNIATSASQQTTINNTAAEINNNDDMLFAFGSVNPFAEDAVSELYRIQSLGLKGIKLHPEYQQFFIDDEIAYPIYETCSQFGLFVYFHTGVDLGVSPPVHATPDRTLRVIELFPKLKVIAAHFGGYRCWDMTEYFLIGKNIYLDTSFTSFSLLSKERMKSMILNHGIEKILFGSDFPWGSGAEAIDNILSLKLTHSENTMILGENAKRLLSL